MTAEIAIMNKTAVALAADSAVTIGLKRKTYNTANKLFTLSKYHPVGAMVFSNANFLGVPWETILKVYRHKLGRKRFPRLQDYANDLIRFLNRANPMFLPTRQERHFGHIVFWHFKRLQEEIDGRIKKETAPSAQKISDIRIKAIVRATIKEAVDQAEKADKLQGVGPRHGTTVVTKYRSVLKDVRKAAFENLPITRNSESQLKRFVELLFTRQVFGPAFSGLVVAGFGEDEFFPSMRSFHLETIVNNRVKYQSRESSEIDEHTSASITAFAQREMVETFITGVDPGYKQLAEGHLDTLFSGRPAAIVNSISGPDDKTKKAMLSQLGTATQRLLEDYKREMAKFQQETYVDAVLNVVGILPADELAIMAETLVSLTSFKRKMSMDAETVGGPIDVAIISKGDGFVWIKRKHYFKPELNPGFLANYYRGG